mmetsp:Transcript_95023/g.182610  ORF Transcript_95023/g.182610 Transcript_95023/m.182610 type:complete len:267 (-) Transcript_95023:260-1060(-)
MTVLMCSALKAVSRSSMLLATSPSGDHQTDHVWTRRAQGSCAAFGRQEVWAMSQLSLITNKSRNRQCRCPARALEALQWTRLQRRLQKTPTCQTRLGNPLTLKTRLQGPLTRKTRCPPAQANRLSGLHQGRVRPPHRNAPEKETSSTQDGEVAFLLSKALHQRRKSKTLYPRRKQLARNASEAPPARQAQTHTMRSHKLKLVRSREPEANTYHPEEVSQTQVNSRPLQGGAKLATSWCWLHGDLRSVGEMRNLWQWKRAVLFTSAA